MRALVGLALTLASASPAVAVQQKILILDDFTVTPWTWTLFFGQSKDNVWTNLDPRHCLFLERQTWTHINSNPNDTSLTISIGGHEQKLSSPKQVAWQHEIQYGNLGLTNVDLSCVDKFMLDLYAVGGSHLPDAMTLSVHDSAFRGGTIGWNGRMGGVYFRKSNFPSNIDWKHITWLKLRQDFHSFPNPTTYSATNFYASLKPGTSVPGSQFDPFEVFRQP